MTRIDNINLTKLDKHSKIYENSSCLGSFVWSSDSKKIAYITEIKNNKKDKSFFFSKLESCSEKKSKDTNEFINENNYEKVKSKLYTPVLYYSFFNKCKTYNFSKKYAHFYDDHWGEQYVGKVKI